jgi:hypothetical protein
VLRKEAELIRIQEVRLGALLAREPDARDRGREVRNEMALLMKLYAAHLTTQQGLGLEPSYLRGPREKPEPSDQGCHAMYPFLTRKEARRLDQIDAAVDRGEINPIELYRLVEPLVKWENEHPRGDQR